MGLEPADCDGRHVHQTHGLGAAQLAADGQIIAVGLFEQGVFKMDAVDFRQEGGMAAVVAPIGIQHPDFRDGGVPLFAPEIFLAEGDVVRIHGQAILSDETLQAGAVQGRKAGQGGYLGRDGVLRFQGFGLFKGRLPGFHGVDHILLDLQNLRVRQLAVQGVELRAADQRAFALADDLDALGGRIGPLVKLAGQVFDREHSRPVRVRLLGGNVQLGL